MNETVKIYKNSPIRIVTKDGEPWFVAKDVCNILEIKNSRDTLNKCLDEDERGVDIIYTPGGNQEMTIVSEAGLYSLILRSRKPEAKAFKRWVTHEVLPSIRKTGAYLSPGMSNEQVKALVATLEEEMYRRIQAENRLAKLEAHAEELARSAIPATPFGELSQKTGRPRTCLVRNYLRSAQEVKQEHFGTYIQLLLPLYAVHFPRRLLHRPLRSAVELECSPADGTLADARRLLFLDLAEECGVKALLRSLCSIRAPETFFDDLREDLFRVERRPAALEDQQSRIQE